MNSLQITHQAVWRLAGPMIISNLSIPLVAAVDTAVVGQLSEPHYIGGIALGGLIFSFLYWGFGFLKMGITGFVARAYGADDKSQINEILLQFIVTAVFSALIIIIFRSGLTELALDWINSSNNVETLATEYTLIRIWGAPAILLIYVFTGFLIGIHNTRAVFYLLLILNLTNIILDLIFVLILDWGVSGVAWATLISEYAALFFGLWLLRHYIKSALAQPRLKSVFAPTKLKQVLSSNGNIFIRTLLLVFSSAYFTAQSANHGEVILAVGAILMHLQGIMSYTLDGFAHATEALCGSCYGAGNKKSFWRSLWLTTLWSGITAVLFCLAYQFFGNYIVSLFTNSTEILAAIQPYMIWIIISPIFSFWSFQLDGLFIGISHTRAMRNAMIISTICFLLLAYATQAIWAYHGLFFAFICFMLIRAITLCRYYPSVKNSIRQRRPTT